MGSELRQRQPRIKSERHLAFIRTLPCLVTGQFGVDAAHIRFGDLGVGKRKSGIAEKPDDKWAVPLCRNEHTKQHSMNEREYWASIGIDPIQVAIKLWGVSGDMDKGESIVANAKSMLTRLD